MLFRGTSKELEGSSEPSCSVHTAGTEGSSSHQLWRKPPILQVDCFLGAFQSHRDGLAAWLAAGARQAPAIIRASGLCLSRSMGVRRTHMEVVAAIDIPLDLVAVTSGSKGFEAVALGDPVALVVGPLLMLLVMTMVGVDDIGELANGAFHVRSMDLGIVQVGVLQLVLETVHQVGHGGGIRGCGSGGVESKATDGICATVTNVQEQRRRVEGGHATWEGYVDYGIFPAGKAKPLRVFAGVGPMSTVDHSWGMVRTEQVGSSDCVVGRDETRRDETRRGWTQR